MTALGVVIVPEAGDRTPAPAEVLVVLVGFFECDRPEVEAERPKYSSPLDPFAIACYSRRAEGEHCTVQAGMNERTLRIRW